ncbi:MAG: hypothetical protein IPO91_19845 [Chloroflexi bacterium]|nr:hypothetical protein [Chloroflexota bacterium]
MLTKLRVNKQTGSTARRILRVRYRDHQTVRGANLRDDQAYHRAMHRRHLLTAHDWGIVTGLALVASGDDAVVVQPGVAVDLYGRLIVLAEPVAIHQADLKGFEGPVQIGIRYSEQTISASRIQETGVVFAATTVLEPKREADYLLLDPPPIAAPPLYLGTIILGGESALIQPDNQGAARRYTRFYAGSIINPDERVRVTLDTEAENDSRRFSVATTDLTSEMQDQLMINRVGDTYFYGEVALKSDQPVTLNSFGLRLEPHAPPETPQAWRMYTAIGTEGEDTDQHPFTELRVELYHPGKLGDPADYRLELGVYGLDEKNLRVFSPFLTVVANGTVIMRGDISADQVLQSPIDADLNDPRFQDLLIDPVFLNQGLEVTFPNADAAGVITVSKSKRPGVQLKNVSGTAINSINLYADVRTNGGRQLFAGRVAENVGSLPPNGEIVYEIDTKIIPADITNLTVLVIAYGSRTNEDVVTGFGLVTVKNELQ